MAYKTLEEVDYYIDRIFAGTSNTIPLEVVERFASMYSWRRFTPALHQLMSSIIGSQNTDYMFSEQLRYDRDMGKRNFCIRPNRSRISRSMGYSDSPLHSSFLRSLEEYTQAYGNSYSNKFNPDDPESFAPERSAYFVNVMMNLPEGCRKRFPQPFIVEE